jgi:uncharacterized damage-inducible protein DinB
MTIAQALLPEFDQEMANTRKALERIPTEMFAFKPHEKSGNMGWLAWHVASLPSWITITLSRDFLDIGDTSIPRPSAPTTAEELLSLFDKNSKEARPALENCPDSVIMRMWTLKHGDRTLMEMPKVAVLRGFVMNHLIHHRGQLTMYLRLNNIPVPALYGPSADEGGF